MIDVAVWVTATVTVAVAVAEPDVAKIVAVPFATAVTRPDDETVATDAADEVHETVTPDITFPPESFTVAVSVAVSPNDGNVSSVSDNSTLTAV